MKKFCILLTALVLPIFAHGQNVRYDAPFPSVSNQTTTPFLVANVPPNSPLLAVCVHPANATPCTNYATTYNSLNAACPNGAQDTPQPQPSACQSTGDAQGNIGFWAPAGTYDYTVCVANQCYGPYTITMGGSGGGGGGSGLADPGSNSIVYRYSPLLTQPATSANIVGLFGGCSGSLLLGADGNCHATGLGNYLTNPSVSQNVIQPFGSTNPTNTCIDDLANVVYRCPEFNWSQLPSSPASLTGGTPATVTLTSTPKGLDATEGGTFVDIGTTGTEEQALITATTCVPGGGSGSCTITFTPANSHSAGYSVGSATVGAQEAANYASLTNSTFGSPHSKVVMNPTGSNSQEITFKAPLFVPGNEMTLDFTGTVVICTPVNGRACVVNSNGAGAPLDTQIVNPTFVPGLTTAPVLVTSTSLTSDVVTVNTATNPETQGIAVGSYICLMRTDFQRIWGCGYQVTAVTTSSVQFAFTNADVGSITSPGAIFLEDTMIEDNGQGQKITNLRMLYPQSAGPGFNSGLLYLNDQAAVVDGFLNNQAMNCNGYWCGPLIMAPGNSADNATIGSFRNLNWTMGCSMNGILWYAGNQLSVGDSVMQGQAQYVVKVQDLRGGSHSADMRTSYSEVGSCGGISPSTPNPDGNIGAAGLIVAGPTSLDKFGAVTSNQWQAVSPQFSSSGTTVYAYWLVVNVSNVGNTGSPGVSSPIYIGWADDNASDNIAVSWARVRGTNSYTIGAVDTVTYDLLRTTIASPPATPPTGTGNFAVSTGIAQCAGFVCSFTDTNSGPTSYAVAAPTFYPELDYCPASICVTPIGNLPPPVGNINTITSIVKLGYLQASQYSGGGNGSPIISVFGPSVSAVQADWCGPDASTLQVTGISCLNTNSGVSGITGTANEITATGAPNVTLSLPASLILPGSLSATTGAFSGAVTGSSTAAFTGVNLTSGAMATVAIANASSTGTTLNSLAKVTGAPSKAVIAATTDINGIIGVVIGGAGTTGNATIATNGVAACTFDGATTAGDFMQISSGTGGDCHDAGASYPASNQVLGIVLSSHGSGGAYNIILGTDIEGGSANGATTLAGLTDVKITAPSDTQVLTYVNADSKWENKAGAGAGGTFEVNGTPLSSATTVNYENGAATDGLTLTFANPSAGNVQLGMTGSLTVPGGGTGLTSFTSGGIPCATASTTLASSAALAAGNIVLGGGAGACVTSAAVSGDVTQSSGVFTIGANKVTSAKTAVVNTYRVCGMVFGSQNSATAVLASADIAPQFDECFVPAASTIVEVDVSADAGTSSVIAGKDHQGTNSPLLSSALATAASGGHACANVAGGTGLDGVTTCSATLAVTSLAAGDYLQTSSATADGVSRQFRVFITFTVN